MESQTSFSRSHEDLNMKTFHLKWYIQWAFGLIPDKFVQINLLGNPLD